MANEALLDKMEHFVNPGLARTFRLMGLDGVELSGQGAFLFDEEGHRYIDCAGGYGVMIHGYRHPRIVAAARRQLDRLAMSSRVLLNRPMIELAELLAHVTPGDLQYSFFCNSGAEAVEAALKFARAATGRTRIVGTHGGFHGKTFGALSVSGRRLYQEPFQPLVPDVELVAYGDLAAARARLDRSVAAMIVEPIQGEGGIMVPPEEYLPGLRQACDQVGALLIADEVQTGMGRTGKLFAVEWSQIVPDLLCLAKALGGGVMPMGAVVGRPRAWEFFGEAPLLHSSTFGGNELAAAVAQEALRVALEEDFPAKALALGRQLKEGLEQIALRFPAVIREVRGRGLMIGVDMGDAGIAGAVMSELFQRRVLAVYTLNNENVIRMIPPLVIASETVDEVVQQMAEAVAAVSGYLKELE